MWPFNKSDRRKIREEEQERIASALQNTFKDMQDRLDKHESEIEKLNKQVIHLIREIARLRVSNDRNEDVHEFFNKFFPENEERPKKRKKAQWQTSTINKPASPLHPRPNEVVYSQRADI